jgi:hypothetical protein
MNIFQISKSRILKRIIQSLTLISVFILSGCVVSLNSWLNENYKTVDNNLPGTWKEIDGTDKWIFHQENKSDIRLVHRENGKLAEFKVETFALENWKLMQLFPAEAKELNSFYQLHLVRGYGLYKYQINADSLWISSMEISVLESINKIENTGLAFQDLDDRLVLLSKTEDLQKFLVAHQTADSLFGEPALLTLLTK